MKLTQWLTAGLFAVCLVPVLNAKEEPREYTGSKSTVEQPKSEVKKIAYARLGEQIRQKKIDVGSLYSVSDENGRFHNIHADKLLMDCTQCHGEQFYKADYLLVSKYKKLPVEHRGRVEKAVCLGCHLPGGMGTPWYGGSTVDDTSNNIIEGQTHE